VGINPDEHPRHEPGVVPSEFEGGVLVALAVDDVVRARQELAAADVELIGDLVWASELTGNSADEGWGWSSSGDRRGMSTYCSRMV
jgi:hypothetical protein